MTTIHHDHTRSHPRDRRLYDLLAYCCGFWGISAVLGGIALIAGMLPIPDSLLDGSPFPTYTIPGLALVLVGAGSLLCGVALPQRKRWTVLAAGALGVAQTIFLGVELVVIGFSWLLAIYSIVTLMTIALAARLIVHAAQPDAGHPAGMARTHDAAPVAKRDA